MTIISIVFDGGGLYLPKVDKTVKPGYGSFIVDSKDFPCEILTRLTYGDRITNNVAEYRTLLEALIFTENLMKEQGKTITQLHIFGDSDLVRLQVGEYTDGVWTATYKCKNKDLLPYRDQIRDILQKYPFTYTHFPRKDIVALLGH